MDGYILTDMEERCGSHCQAFREPDDIEISQFAFKSGSLEGIPQCLVEEGTIETNPANKFKKAKVDKQIELLYKKGLKAILFMRLGTTVYS